MWIMMLLIRRENKPTVPQTNLSHKSASDEIKLPGVDRVEYLQQIDLEIMNLNDTFNIVWAYPNVFHNFLFLGWFL